MWKPRPSNATEPYSRSTPGLFPAILTYGWWEVADAATEEKEIYGGPITKTRPGTQAVRWTRRQVSKAERCMAPMT